MKEKLGLNPWLTIWTKPRKTIRALAQCNLSYKLTTLCWIYGFQYLLQLARFLAMGKGASLLFIIIASAILAIPVGYISFNVIGFFYFALGKLIKGKGSFKEIRAATSWSSVPMIVTIVMWLVLIALNRTALFVPGSEHHISGTVALINMVAAAIQVVVAIWAFIILLHTLGEVQGFSAWMGLLNVVLAMIALFILLFLISWGVSALTHAI